MSKDINLRIKAAILGVHAEDYYNDRTIEDADLLFTGVTALPADFWETHGNNVESWHEQARTYYRVRGPLVNEWHPNQFLYDAKDDGFEAIVRKIDGEAATLEVTQDYRSERHAVWGITARNREQNLALNLLLDPDIDFVTILGPAGTGKTLLTLAAGLAQTLDTNRFSEIIMTRVTIPLGEDIGFLPGTEEEKMEPWMGALMDNLEVLTQGQEGGSWGRAATQDLLRHRIKIRSLNFMRGRTFLNRYLILDEAQNLTSKQMKALVTRAGPRHQARLPRQHRADRHALPHRDDLGTHLRRQPLPRLAARRPRHAGARRALAARRFRLGSALSAGPANHARPRGRTGIPPQEAPDARADDPPPAASRRRPARGPRADDGQRAARHRHAGEHDAVARRRVQDRPDDRPAAARGRPDRRGPGDQRVPAGARHAPRRARRTRARTASPSSRSATRASTPSRCRAASSA